MKWILWSNSKNVLKSLKLTIYGEELHLFSKENGRVVVFSG